MVEIYLLEQLAAFHRCGTLSAAAEELHITQPSLSRSMQKLEDVLGVKLFDRSRNRITLNRTGEMAAGYAEGILQSEKVMEQSIRNYDQSLHTVSLGFCAPGPQILILPGASARFEGMAVSARMERDDALLEGLHSHRYNCVFLSHPVEEEGMFCKEYLSEHLYLSVPQNHPAATRSSIAFSEMDGQSFLMYKQVGIWEAVVRKMMPKASFFPQEQLEALGELEACSSLPSFVSDISRENLDVRKNGRVAVPFSDPEAEISYYMVCREENKNRFLPLLRGDGNSFSA